MAGNFDYDRKKKDTVVCWRKIGSFFVVAGNFHYDQKKKIHYGQKKKDTIVFLMGRQFWRLRPEKKRYSRLSGGLCCCISLWFWREMSIFFVVAGNFDYDRKKIYIQLSVGGKLAVFFVAGNFHYDRKKN